MIKLKITIYQDPVQVTSCIQNFVSEPEEYEPGVPVGYGVDLWDSMADLYEKWLDKYNEEVEFEIVKTVIR